MRTHPILLLAVGLTWAACDDTSGPPDDRDDASTEGTLVVTTSTGGNGPDPDDYQLMVDVVDSYLLAPTGSADIALPAGQHTLRLLGVAAQCSVTPGVQLEVDVPSQDTASVAFEVSCLLVDARITTGTIGLDLDPDGYRLTVDGTDRGAIAANDTVAIRLAAGSRIVGLAGLAPNCTIEGPGSRTVTIGDTEVAPIELVVVCTATSGVIGVVISGNGVGAVHQATVDSGPAVTVVGPSWRP